MPEDQEEAGALFRAGRIGPAIAAANAAVRRAPTDPGARILLAELLLFDGNLDRADVVLDTASRTDPGIATVVAEFRQLLRAETARQQIWREGRMPEFLGEPTPALRAILAALVALRAGDVATAASRAAEAEAARPRAPGMANGTAFDDFRDADDLCAGFVEVLTTTGKCFWIPTERIASAELHPPRRPRDLAWRRASLSVIDGPEGDVYLPALYPALTPDLADPLRLGRATEWVETAPGLVRGQGQRVFLVGESALGMMDLTTLRFDA